MSSATPEQSEKWKEKSVGENGVEEEKRKSRKYLLVVQLSGRMLAICQTPKSFALSEEEGRTSAAKAQSALNAP
jgi:hypothetical protein